MTEIWTPHRQLDEVVDITAVLARKLAAVRAHETQCSAVPFDEAFAGLARYRGAMHCWPEGTYAEAFRSLRRKG